MAEIKIEELVLTLEKSTRFPIFLIALCTSLLWLPNFFCIGNRRHASRKAARSNCVWRTLLGYLVRSV